MHRRIFSFAVIPTLEWSVFQKNTGLVLHLSQYGINQALAEFIAPSAAVGM
jgi:hypothetical protein